MSRIILICLLAILSFAGQAAEASEDRAGTYTVGQVVNAHTLMVCNSKEHMLDVAAAYKESDAKGEARWSELEKTKTVLGEAACGRIDGKNMVKIVDLPVFQEMIGDVGKRERMTVVKLETVGGGRHVWGALIGEYTIKVKTAGPPPGSIAPKDVGNRIAALKTKAGSDAWDEEVREIFLAAFDSDASGEIDAEKEIRAISCEVWRTMDRRIKAADSRAGLAWTYGFKPSSPGGTLEWVGDAFGINENLRGLAFERIKSCGVDIGR